MCGIAGAIGAFAQTEADQIVESMLNALSHRGPDDMGRFCWSTGANTVALGNRRLSIQDLSAAGRQPMTEQSGRYWITFNGEIYNFRELRKLLDPDNLLFRTGTDTEAVLHAYDRYSDRSFRMFRGMFALALLDKNERKIHLVRDPLGIKPLYYYAAGDKLLFASEVEALLRSGEVPRRINQEAISYFLRHGWIGKNETAILGVELLQPGHVLTVDLNRKKLEWAVSRYEADVPLDSNLSDADRNESTAHLLHILAQSVKSHLVSDVPVGLFLSGGIDSTTILHLMRQGGCNSLKTFTVAFPERDFSESQVSKQVSHRYDSEHQEIQLSEPELLGQLPAALAAMDQPTMDGVNTFIIAKAAHSAGIKVALSGLGGDELFAGYPSFRRALWARTAATLPTSIRVTLAAIGRAGRKGPRYEKLWDLLASDCTPASAYAISRRLFRPDEIAALVPQSCPSPPLAEASLSGDSINDVSRLEMRGYMTDLLLRDTDFMSMASSLEVRVPFIDKVVVRHVLQLPGRWKIARSIPKALLLDAMRGEIPSYVWQRPKMGFVFPFDRWMRSALREQVIETLWNPQLVSAAGIEPQAARDVWRRFLEGRVRWSKPWSLFVLLRWCERHRAFG